MSPMIRRSLTMEHALLGFLQPGPLHGYQLHRQICDPAGLKGVWNVKQSQLYALLGKLEEAGYITSTIQPQDSRPARRVYHLTPSGREAFQDWLSRPVLQPRQMRQEFQAKLYFARQAGDEVCTRLFEVQRQACYAWLANYETRAGGAGGDEGFAFLVERFRIGQIQAILDWLELCIKTNLSS